jgi:hypothetical protein
MIKNKLTKGVLKMKDKKTETDGLKDTTKSDSEYWKAYTSSENDSMMSHDISLDVICKFRGLNDGVIYETKETEINCNLKDLDKWFSNLKKTIRMLDESVSDKEVGGF